MSSNFLASCIWKALVFMYKTCFCFVHLTKRFFFMKMTRKLKTFSVYLWMHYFNCMWYRPWSSAAYNHKIVSKKLRKFENYKEKTWKVWKILEKKLWMFKNYKIQMTRSNYKLQMIRVIITLFFGELFFPYS